MINKVNYIVIIFSDIQRQATSLESSNPIGFDARVQYIISRVVSYCLKDVHKHVQEKCVCG